MSLLTFQCLSSIAYYLVQYAMSVLSVATGHNQPIWRLL